jgi:hypothetical protein
MSFVFNVFTLFPFQFKYAQHSASLAHRGGRPEVKVEIKTTQSLNARPERRGALRWSASGCSEHFYLLKKRYISLPFRSVLFLFHSSSALHFSQESIGLVNT